MNRSSFISNGTIRILLIISVTVLLSCNKSRTYESILKSRTLLIYEFDSLRKTESYDLVITENDSSINYVYENTLDSTRLYKYRFSKEKNEIWDSWGERYLLTKQNILKQSILFDRYEPFEYWMDGTEAMIFSREFGVLAIKGGWGYHSYFISDEVNQIPIDQLIKLLD